jgi:hypothetical protein
MAFIEKLAARLLARSSAVGMDVDVQRQNTPPDEVDAELAEAMHGKEFLLPRREAAVMKARAKAAGE